MDWKITTHKNSPINVLSHYVKAFPYASDCVLSFMRAKGQPGYDWPNWCMLPISAWIAIASGGEELTSLEDRQKYGQWAAELAAIYTWRYSQGIYRFDDTLYDAIINTNISDEIPSDVLYRLPEWCIYVETKDLFIRGIKVLGFWCHLDYHCGEFLPEGHTREEIRIVFNGENEKLLPGALFIKKCSLKENLKLVVDYDLQTYERYSGTQVFSDYPALKKEEEYRRIDQMAAPLAHALSLVLYLCSEEPEVDDLREPGKCLIRPTVTKTKKGFRFFPAPKPRLWAVGKETGHAIRESHNRAKIDGVSPHIRRAHWHGYWKGPRDGERVFIYKWLSPIFVEGNKNKDENE